MYDSKNYQSATVQQITVQLLFPFNLLFSMLEQGCLILIKLIKNTIKIMILIKEITM